VELFVDLSTYFDPLERFEGSLRLYWYSCLLSYWGCCRNKLMV